MKKSDFSNKMREAYLSEIDNYARVTFDRDQRYQYEEEFNLIPDESKICHYDHEDLFFKILLGYARDP